MTISARVSNFVSTISIDRPEALNAMDPPTQLALREELISARDNDDVRVIVITGAGERSFSAGADLKHVQSSPQCLAKAWTASDRIAADNGAYVRLLNFQSLGIWKPMIAAINGYCIGGGLEVALQCDLRVASDNATFGLPEVKIGSIAGVCGALLYRLVPAAHAMKLLLSGEKIDAAEAQRIGLVSDVWPLADLGSRTSELAARIAANAPLSVAATKRLVYETENVPRETLFNMTELVFGMLKDTEDRQEGRRAFAEKRDPRFSGR